MNTNDYIVAVEIGSSKIKCAVGRRGDTPGSLSVIGIEEEHQQPQYVRYGCVQNVKEVANELNKAIGRLNNRLTPAGSAITGVYLGVGGRSLKSTPTNLSLRMAGVTEVTPEIVRDLLSRAAVGVPDTELLDVEPVNYQVDGKDQGVDPVGVLGGDLSAKVNLVSCRCQNKRNLRMAVTEKLGLKINGYIVRPMALADLVLTSDEKRLGVMLVDFGAETTTVAVYKYGVMVYLATIPLGSRHITRDLTELKCTEEKAEDIKRTIGNCADEREPGSRIDAIDLSETNRIVRARALEIMANIAAQTGYAGLKNSDIPKGIVLVGGGALLRGFSETLASKYELPVRRGSLPAPVRVTGSRISADEDLDVIALLYRLAQETELEPCVKAPKPVEAAPADIAETEPDSAEAEEEDDFSLDEGNTAKKNGGFFSGFWNRVKNGMTSSDDAFDDSQDEKFD